MTNSEKPASEGGVDETGTGAQQGPTRDDAVANEDDATPTVASPEDKRETDSMSDAKAAEPDVAEHAAPERDATDNTVDTGTEARASTVPPVRPRQPDPEPVAQPRIARGPGFMTMLLGGLVAGAIGYALAYYVEFRPFAGPAADDPAAAIAELQATVAAQAERLSTVESRADETGSQVAGLSDSLTGMDQRVAELAPGEQGIPPAVLEDLRGAALAEVESLMARVDDIDSRLGSLSDQVSGLAEQVSAGGGAASSGEALDAYQRQLAALQQELDAQRAAMTEAQDRAAALGAAAEAQQRAVLAEASLARVRAAVQGGGSFTGALSDLTSATEAEIPEVLLTVADTGVKTLPQLQDSFDAAARAALDAAVEAEAGQGTTMERLGNFLRSQTGARSLVEREGDDPDAILSRAQARLSEGDLSAALDEIAGLDEAAQDAMSGWISDARARVDAIAAVDRLSAAIGAE